ncbi:hypothetical protein FOT46_04585 [Citrobacter freundii]|nr:hypothetical protein [Citrobacter freundii]GAL39585.1 hypothetical protein CIFRE_10_00310 [Citrobacter freundii ATCC 8090 = MTCC 1658 = NBRC 12681]
MQVTIDGVPYAPTCNSVARIGIAITTHNRADVLKRSLEQHMNHLPIGVPNARTAGRSSSLVY